MSSSENFFEDVIIKQYLLFNKVLDDTIVKIIIDYSIMVYCQIDNDVKSIEHLIIENYPTPSGKWKYNVSTAPAAANIRVPTEPYIPFYKLSEKDNIYDFISSSMCVLHPREFISGERIQYLADVVIGDKETLYRGNPYNNIFSRQIIDMDDPNAVSHFSTSSRAAPQNFDFEIQQYKRVFVFTHLLERFYASPLGEKMEGRILITHNSDDSASDHTDTLKYQFSQNAYSASPSSSPSLKMCGIPIGIENNRWFKYSDFEKLIWCDAMNPRSPIIKTKNVYFYFSMGTHSTRTEAYNILCKKPGLEWNIRRPKNEYFEELAKHRYAICPRGNGVDTHRVWECLYLNVIPIVVRADYIDAFVGLPIIVLENWNEFDIDTLSKEPVFEKQNFAKLTMSYWVDRIQSI